MSVKEHKEQLEAVKQDSHQERGAMLVGKVAPGRSHKIGNEACFLGKDSSFLALNSCSSVFVVGDSLPRKPSAPPALTELGMRC
eukprot:scaffold606692_cov48-Prasinocladus_malaysianus.AAC.1